MNGSDNYCEPKKSTQMAQNWIELDLCPEKNVNYEWARGLVVFYSIYLFIYFKENVNVPMIVT